jgi:ankyrin repeat protein
MVAAGGGTLLHDAALKGHIAVVRVLLEHGAKLDARNATGGTPLHDAALAGQTAVVELLLDKGAAINAKDTEGGETPLHRAASWNRGLTVELLLNRGADRTIRNKAGKTAFDLARENSADEALAAFAVTAAKPAH